MLESSFHLRKRTYSSHIKKTKEEQEKDLIGIPKNIGPYELLEKLKDGGYSKIYKAKSCYTGDFVAIKAIEKLDFQQSVEDVLLMVRQAEVLKILKHRNIINLYEIYESQKFFYLIMDYLPNGDLIEQIIKKKRFQEQEALAIFSQLVDALYYMHKNEICHRDIRTEKILFDKKNIPKLVGFSYSSFYTKGKKIRDSYGSLCYACPEIIQNDYYNPELADVWSLGVVLYVMVCGYLPFSEDDDNETRYLIINGKVDYPPQISNKVKDLLKHMLDIDPNKRYTFQKIVRHPWFKPFDEATLTGGCNTYKMIYPVDERILKLIVIYGFNKKEVDKDLKQNIFNSRTGLYKQLTEKVLHMGYSSLSDLCSKDFMDFSRDKENIISDGEIKYKKYINKILEKIRKVERYVDDYKRKEDKIIKDLEDIYKNAVDEENKNKNKKNSLKKYEHLKTENYNNKIHNKNNIQNNNSKRRSISPFQADKEKITINNIYNETKNSKNKNETNKDFDTNKAYNDENNLELYKKNNNILNLELSDFEINVAKIKRTNSNPNIKDFVQKLIEKDDKSEDSIDYNIDMIRDSRRKRQYSVMVTRRKRNYLNTGNENDYFLKRPKDNSERKKIIEDSYKKSIKNVIIEENINEEKGEEKQDSDEYINLKVQETNVNNNKEEIINDNKEKEIKTSDNKKKKSLRFSLSFMDDDEEEEEEEEENYANSISKIESKRVSMYDIDEEIKELKEIKNNIQSPLRSSFLKRNANDNNMINFNTDSNNIIFGERLEEDTSRKNSNALLLEDINKKYDLLTELKRLNDNANSKKKKVKTEEKPKIKEKEYISEFNYDSFGESKNEKEKDENKNSNMIVFDDKLEISFNEEKSENNNDKNRNDNIIEQKLIQNKNEYNTKEKGDLKIFYHDQNKINKLKLFSRLEEFLFCISNINSKKERKYNYKFIKDIFPIRKLNINNDEINIRVIGTNIKKINQKFNNKYSKNHERLNTSSKKDNNNTYHNIDEIYMNENNKKTRNKNKQKSHYSKNTKIDKSLNKGNINNNIFNFYNQNDNFNQKIYIYNNNRKNSQDSTRSKGKYVNNTKIKNNIIINSNNNTINNISIKNKNNYGNFYKNNNSIFNPKIINTEEKKSTRNNNIIHKINYTQFINKLNLPQIHMNLTDSKKDNITKSALVTTDKLSNKFKNKNLELYLINSEKLNSKKKINNYPNKKRNELLFINKSDNNEPIINKKLFDEKNWSKKDDNLYGKKNSNIITKNLIYDINNSIMPKTEKKRKGHLSIEKLFHLSLMEEEDEILEEPEIFIEKLKIGQKLNKLLFSKKSNIRTDLNKFINKKPSIDKNKKSSNYSMKHIKQLNCNKNSYFINNYDYDDENLNDGINLDIINNEYLLDNKINKLIDKSSKNNKKEKKNVSYESQGSSKIAKEKYFKNNDKLLFLNKTIFN